MNMEKKAEHKVRKEMLRNKSTIYSNNNLKKILINLHKNIITAMKIRTRNLLK
jgi:hypothetical protein